MTRNDKEQVKKYDINTSYASDLTNETPEMYNSFKVKTSEDQKLFSPTFNAYQTHISNNDGDASNNDSCISLRPINFSNNSSEVCIVTNTKRFEAPKIDSFKTFKKEERKESELSFNENLNNLHMKKSINIHREIMNKRKKQLEEFKGDFDFYQL